MFEALTSLRDGFIMGIRATCSAQSETWRCVPWLSLQADGRDGGMGFYDSAYRYGLWKLHIANWHQSDVYVECMTGTILATYEGETKTAPDRLVLILGNHLSMLDATAVCEDLRKQIAAPRPSYISEGEAESRERIREKLIRQLKLTERYTRQSEALAA